jgi:NhaP-type Na+/H+ or K+/H+ antiporter
VFIGSIAIGVAIGILVTVFMKNMRFLVKEKGISEVALTIFSGFLCYVLS